MVVQSRLAKRVIPTVLLDGSRLVKGIRFGDLREAGLAKSTLRVLNAQDPDELMIINISRTQTDFEIAEQIILDAVRECEVPITVGGGIKSVEDAKKFFGAGVEKVLVTSSIVDNPNLVLELAQRFGSQAVVAGLEFRFTHSLPTRLCNRGSRTVLTPSIEDTVTQLESLGAGELLFIDVENDGVKSGLEIQFLREMSEISKIPVIALGGVGNFSHLVEGFRRGLLDAIACGTLFTFGDNNPIRARAYLKNQGIQVRG